MDNIDKRIEFLSYIRTPLSESSIVVLLSANNIKYERSQLYSDFVQSLMSIVFDTYMGDDITNEEQQSKHFNWCFEKTVDTFKSEDINLGTLTELREYYREFLVEVYYPMPNKESDKDKIDNIYLFWKQLFDYNTTKTKADIDCLLSVYKIFETSINEKQPIRA